MSGRDPQDRRRAPLSLTERGAEFVANVPFADENDLLVQSLSAMGDEKARQYDAALNGNGGVEPLEVAD